MESEDSQSNMYIYLTRKSSISALVILLLFYRFPMHCKIELEFHANQVRFAVWHLSA